MTDRLVHRLIEAQAEQTPDAVAVAWDGGSYTFGELDRRANRLANLLVRHGVRPERLVGVSMGPSPLLLVSMLAIWKAGGAYVPIDPSLPRDVAEGMVTDAGVTLLIGNGPVAVELPAVRTIDLDGLDLADQPAVVPPVEMVADNLAYCVFTSGSTGKPKLVAAAHASFANHGYALRDQLSLGPQDRVLQSTAMAFDAALEEILPAWLAGGAVVMPSQRKFTSRELTDCIERLSVTMVSLPSAYWHLWVEDLATGTVRLPPSLRTVFIGGDKILVDKLAEWYRIPDAERINWVSDYGPTETSISVALHHPARDGIGGAGSSEDSDYALVPLGRPFAQAALYVLDADLRPVPEAMPGDLWVGGPPVTRGYYGAPAMTADRYRPDPQGPPGARMYRTGDRAAWLPDGMLSFLGRSDRQVKIRGHRVELGQVESALHNLDGVKDAVVIVVDEPPLGSSLIAYAEVQPGVSESEVRTRLAERLPDSMLPSAIVLMDRIPRSPLNGKVARADLPPIGRARRTGRVDNAAMTTLESAVAMVVGDVLDLPVTDRYEDFFAVGGDSLRGMQVLNRVAEVTGVALTFEQFRTAPHVAGIAALVTQHRGGSTAGLAIVPAATRGERQPASHGQQALWFLDQVHRGEPVYAIPVCYRIRGPLDLERLDAALTTIVARHEALRTVLVRQGGTVWQHIRAAEPVRTQVVDVADLADAARRAQRAAEEPFELGVGPLLRSSAFRVDEEQWLWLLDVHHAVFDAWSLAVFWRELTALYQGRSLPEVSVQFADYVGWQQRWLQGPEAAAQRSYWQARLAGVAEPAELGTRQERREGRPGTDGFALQLPPGALDAGAVERVAQDCRSTPFVVLLAAFLVMLRRTTGTDELVVGVPVACRNRPGTENIIGYLVNTVAVRTRLAGSPSFRDVVASTDAAMAEALTNQELPFAEAVEAARSGRAGGQPIFRAMFGFQSTPLDGLDGIAGLSIAEHYVHSATAKTTLTWTARQEAGGLVGEIEYAAGRFDPASAGQWQAELLATLGAALARPDEPIDLLVPTPELSTPESAVPEAQLAHTGVAGPLPDSLT